MSRRSMARKIPGNRGSRFPNGRGGFSVYADDIGRQMDIFGIPRPRGSVVTVPAQAENAKKPGIRIVTDSETTSQLLRTFEIPEMGEIAQIRTARTVLDANLTSHESRTHETASASSSLLDPASASCSLAVNTEPIQSGLQASSLDPAIASSCVPLCGNESSNEKHERHSPVKCSSLNELLDKIPQNLGPIKRMTISMEMDTGERLVIDGKINC